MSYYKVKSVNFDTKNGKIWVTAACNNVSPITYFRSEYCPEDTFEEKVQAFWISVLDGNMQFNTSCRWYPIVRSVYDKIEDISRNINDFWSNNRSHETNYYEELTEYAAKTYLVPLVLKTPITPDEEYEAGFCSKCINAWKEIDRERAEKGIISVRAAIWSSVLPNCDVLLTDDSKTTIVAWKKNYNNAGLLDNSDQSAVLINGDHFSFLGYATIDQVKEIFIAYPDLVRFCVSESAYQSEEHCIMDGYELVFESEEKRLYVKSNSRGICSYAEIEGFC